MPDMLLTALRNTMREIRSHLPSNYQSKSSHSICNKIGQLEQYRQAKHLALYQATRGEVDLTQLWNSAPLQGKFCYFPALQGDTLLFLPATPATPFKKNRYGILEPDVDFVKAIDIAQLDLMILPLLVFDRLCHRIGMGAGYYDRTLADKSPKFLLGVGYPFQRVP
jgi:5-formyltetrahydrofolate cyclo-ligase